MTQSKEKKADKKTAKKPKKLTPIQELINQVRVLQYQVHQLTESLNAVGAMTEYTMNCFQVITDYTMDIRNKATQEQKLDKEAKKKAMDVYRAQTPEAKEKNPYEKIYENIRQQLVAALAIKNKPVSKNEQSKEPSKKD